jgi:hypothetical protein
MIRCLKKVENNRDADTETKKKLLDKVWKGFYITLASNMAPCSSSVYETVAALEQGMWRLSASVSVRSLPTV